MGSPVSPIVANVYMEDLEQNIIATAPEDCQPRSWKRCVDDIICLVHTGKAEQLQQRMNTTDCTGSIVFIRDDGENNGMPFLDAKFTKKEDGCVKSTVYRKKTRTRTLCPTNSKHQKPGVVMNRSETTTTEEGDKKEEMEHLRGASRVRGCPSWAFKKVTDNTKQTRKTDSGTKNKDYRSQVVIPHVEGVSEREP